ncbi:putative development/cell death domain-containing protein [Helianthus anomalus]
MAVPFTGWVPLSNMKKKTAILHTFRHISAIEANKVFSSLLYLDYLVFLNQFDLIFYFNSATKAASMSSNQSASARNLRKTDLGAVIFGATHHTINECLSLHLFG